MSRTQRLVLSFGVFVVCLSSLVYWTTRMTPAEKQLVGQWKMSRSWTTDDGDKGSFDYYYIFNLDRSYQRWWIDPVTRRCSNRVSRGRFGIRPGNPPKLTFRSDRPFLQRLFQRRNGSALPIVRVAENEFEWTIRDNQPPELFTRVESLPIEYPAK